MEKSIVVEVVRSVPHPKYKKFIKKTTTFVAHDEENACKLGDIVTIAETRRLSKLKCWRLLSIQKKN